MSHVFNAFLRANYEIKIWPETSLSFGLSVLTMFQVLTGDSWAIIARTLLFTRSGTYEHPSGELGELGVAFFFVSYIMLMSFTLINVVIAVLLEKTMEEDVDDPYDDEIVHKFD